MSTPYVRPTRFSEAGHAIALKLDIQGFILTEDDTEENLGSLRITTLAIHDLMKEVDTLKKEVHALKNVSKYDHGGGPL